MCNGARLMLMMLALGRFYVKRRAASAHDAGPGPVLGEKRCAADVHDAGPGPVLDERVRG